MTPAEADLAFIETARRCDFYGIRTENIDTILWRKHLFIHYSRRNQASQRQRRGGHRGRPFRRPYRNQGVPPGELCRHLFVGKNPEALLQTTTANDKNPLGQLSVLQGTVQSILRIRDIRTFESIQETIEFIFDGRNDCKNFWKKFVLAF